MALVTGQALLALVCRVCGKPGTRLDPIGTTFHPAAGMDRGTHKDCAFK